MKVQLHKEKLLWQSAMTVIVPRRQKAKEMFFVLCLAVISTLFSPLLGYKELQVEIVFSLLHLKITKIIMAFQFPLNKIPPFLENV